MATNTRGPITRAPNDRLVPGVVGRQPTAPPPAGSGPAGPGDFSNDPGAGARPVMGLGGGPGRSPDGGSASTKVGQQTAQSNVTGATPFMDTPGMRIASQRVSGTDIPNDPGVSAALADFNARIAPQMQNRAGMMGLGRSTAALNADALAKGSMLSPLYESAMQREQARLGNMNTAAENELGRRERSSARVADANANMVNQLMQLSNTQYGRGQQTGQNLMSAGGTFRDISQQANNAATQDFLRRQALGEQAVYAPFGGLAQAGLGSTTSSSGK